MITSRLIHAAEVILYQIFSCFAKNAIEVNPIVVFVKYIIQEWELIVVTKKQLISHQILQPNAEEQQKKEQDAKTKQLIRMGAAICTKFYKRL